MDYKFLSIDTRIAIGQFDATIIEYDVIEGYSGLFPVYVARFDTGETEPIHHTDITGLIYDNPMPIDVIEGRKALLNESDDYPEPREETYMVGMMVNGKFEVEEVVVGGAGSYASEIAKIEAEHGDDAPEPTFVRGDIVTRRGDTIDEFVRHMVVGNSILADDMIEIVSLGLNGKNTDDVSADSLVLIDRENQSEISNRLAAAREAQEQLRDELAVITAERDALYEVAQSLWGAGQLLDVSFASEVNTVVLATLRQRMDAVRPMLIKYIVDKAGKPPTD